MADLTRSYLGLKLKNPILASSSGLTGVSAVQIASTLYKNGHDHNDTMFKELADWMIQKDSRP